MLDLVNKKVKMQVISIAQMQQIKMKLIGISIMDLRMASKVLKFPQPQVLSQTTDLHYIWKEQTV